MLRVGELGGGGAASMAWMADAVIPPPVSMGKPMGTATGESPTATRMSARTWAFVRLTEEPSDGGPQPRRTSVRSAARASDCMVLSGELGSSEATRRRASSRRRGVTAARPSAAASVLNGW